MENIKLHPTFELFHNCYPAYVKLQINTHIIIVVNNSILLIEINQLYFLVI